MKRWYYILCIITPLLGCEDVVDVDLNTQETRLIIDGLVRVDIESPSTPVRLKFFVTSPFFENSFIPAEVQDVVIRNDDENGFTLFTMDPENLGQYVPLNSDGNPVEGDLLNTELLIGENIILFFRYENQLYIARTSFAPSTPITSIEQGNGILFDEDDTEVIVGFTDIPDQENYYVFDFDFGEFHVLDDQFIEGQHFNFSYFYDKNLNPGDQLNISILGAEQEFFDYMNVLVDQQDLTENGPFQIPVTTPRGNVLLTEDIDNIELFDNTGRPQEFVLGYFAVSQEFKTSITIE